MRRPFVPVIIGAAQYIQHKGTEKPLDPLGLMVKTSLRLGLASIRLRHYISLLEATHRSLL
jgi:hypothetical protein